MRTYAEPTYAKPVNIKPYINYATKPVVIFDPREKEHRDAYRLLVKEGRQHPELRFHMEHPYPDIVSLMKEKLSLYAVDALGEDILLGEVNE